MVQEGKQISSVYNPDIRTSLHASGLRGYQRHRQNGDPGRRGMAYEFRELAGVPGV